MASEILQRLNAALSGTRGVQRLVALEPVGGGCISQVFRGRVHEQFTNGLQRSVLVKLGPPPERLDSESGQVGGLLAAEAHGLELLRPATGFQIPQVLAHGQLANETEFLLLEWIENGAASGAAPSLAIKPGLELDVAAGRKLAQLHRERSWAASQPSAGSQPGSEPDRPPCYGLDRDNFIGATPQPNPWTANWTEFWCQHRIGFQLRLAERRRLLPAGFARQENALMHSIEKLLDGVPRQPTLIHGDLWSGNYLCTRSGQIALIDPAVYYADREAEFGMTTLFGGFGHRFYDAYRESYPLADGWQQRVEIYRLYHLLNHLNLFGNSYLSQCLELVRKYAV